MPSPLVVRFGKVSALTSVAVGLLLCAIGLLGLVYGFMIQGDLWGLLLGLALGGMGGYGLWSAVRQLLNRKPQIILDDATLTDCRTQRCFAWKDLESARLYEEFHDGGQVQA